MIFGKMITLIEWGQVGWRNGTVRILKNQRECFKVELTCEIISAQQTVMIPSSRVWMKNLDRFRKDRNGYSSELKPWQLMKYS